MNAGVLVVGGNHVPGNGIVGESRRIDSTQGLKAAFFDHSIQHVVNDRELAPPVVPAIEPITGGVESESRRKQVAQRFTHHPVRLIVAEGVPVPAYASIISGPALRPDRVLLASSG